MSHLDLFVVNIDNHIKACACTGSNEIEFRVRNPARCAYAGRVGRSKPRKRPNATEQARRNALVVDDRRRGLPWSVIAEKYGLSDRQCQNIWNDRPAVEPTTAADPIGDVLERIASLEVSIADYDSRAVGAKNESVRLGALNKRVELQAQLFDLRREYGIVPAPDELWAATEFIQLVLELLAKADLDDEDRARLEAARTNLQAHPYHWAVRASRPEAA